MVPVESICLPSSGCLRHVWPDAEQVPGIATAMTVVPVPGTLEADSSVHFSITHRQPARLAARIANVFHASVGAFIYFLKG